jgi:hypothetical protein
MNRGSRILGRIISLPTSLVCPPRVARSASDEPASLWSVGHSSSGKRDDGQGARPFAIGYRPSVLPTDAGPGPDVESSPGRAKCSATSWSATIPTDRQQSPSRATSWRSRWQLGGIDSGTRRQADLPAAYPTVGRTSVANSRRRAPLAAKPIVEAVETAGQTGVRPVPARPSPSK